MKKKVTIVGLGYVGLPTLLILLNTKKFLVYGYDIDTNKIDNLKKGITSINEKDVKITLKNALKNKNLFFSDKLHASNYFIICVPSNINKKYRQNLTPLFNSIDKILTVLKKNDLIIIETTSEVGTTENILKYIYKKNKSLFDRNINKPKFFMAYCPEKVFPGNTFYEIKNNPRVIGGINQKSNKISQNFFKNYCKKIYLTNSKSAEISNLVENSYRNVQIGFVNELANYTEKKKLDVAEIIKLSNLHPRINLLSPGIGVGGHCIPIDPHFLVKNKLSDFKLIQEGIKANKKRTNYIIKIIKKEILEKKYKEVSFFGITYKPDIDDLRESPALIIIKEISKFNKLRINLFDPHIKSKNLSFGKNTTINPKIIGKDKSILKVLLVSHKQFLKYKKNKEFLNFTY